VRWGCAAGISIVALLAGLCVAPTAWAGGRVTLTSPRPYQVFQRDVAGHGDIVVAGRGTGFVGPVQVRWGDGEWLTVPRRGDGRFSAVLTHRAAGQKTVTVRPALSPSCAASVHFIGVGDIFVIAGQSNAVGLSDTFFKYRDPTLRAALFGNDYHWGDLRDPTDSARGQRDRVSADVAAGGSVWPGVATALMAAEHVPVAFVPCAHGGTTIAAWQRRAAAPLSSGTLYGSMARRIAAVGGRVRAVLFWQGEADARNGTPGGAYEAALRQLAGDIRHDFGCHVVVAQIGDYCAERWTGVSVVAVRLAQQAAWGRHGVVAGPVLYDIDLGDRVHFVAPAAIGTAARRWAASILRGVLERSVARPPRLTSASYDGDRTITLRFDVAAVPLRGGPVGGIVIESQAGPVPSEAELALPPDRVLVTLAARAEGPLSVSLGADRGASGASVPVDASKWQLPPLMFIAWPVTLVAP
jgi:sialate O-acetylesterase